ncbi:MAG: ScpA family protein [Candidatus Micrarchaeota archaeon]
MANQAPAPSGPRKIRMIENQGFNYIEEMVAKPTWKEILLDLIDSNRIDPWNIDLVEISNAFLGKVREMERMDLGVQANVILAAAILLRYKSNYLSALQQAELTEYIPEELPLDMGPVDDLPELTLSSRIPPKRQISLDELVTEMERIIRYDSEERAVRTPRGAIVDTVDFELEEKDIEQKMGQVFEKIKQSADNEGWSLFSRVVGGDEKREMVYTLLSVLHLVQEKKIDIRQDKMFGEIFIKLLEKC